MYVVVIKFDKETILEDIILDVEEYLKSVVEDFFIILAYEFNRKQNEYELCFYTNDEVTAYKAEFLKNKLKVSGLIGKIEVYQNKLIYKGRTYGKR